MAARGLPVDFEEILVFTRVVQGGSFTAAAKALELPKSTVSRKVADLETRVGARLLQRTTRSLKLTDIGRVYYEHCLRIVSEVEQAELAVAELQSTPRGVLRVTLPVAMSVLGSFVAEYLGLYPEVRIEMVCTDRRVDLVEERFDLALRAGASPDSSLIARRVGTLRRRLVAAPEIAARLRRAKQIADLESQPCITFAPEGSTWDLRFGAKSAQITVAPRLVVNDFEMLRSVARAGFGIALLPEHLAAEDLRTGRLVPILRDWSAPPVPIFALYPSARHLAPPVVAFLDLLQRRLVFEPAAAG
ncbi:MAG TPA: LysR family transcriptional regulator [Polyangiaceae bacterium]